MNAEFEKWWEKDCPSAYRIFINKADAKYIFLAGAAAGYTKGVTTMRERCAEVVEIYVGKNEDYYCIEDIAAMEYNEKEELKNWCDIEGVAP